MSGRGNSYSGLLFRRQFLYSPRVCNVPENWKKESVKDYYLYAHPDLDINVLDNQDSFCFALAGFIIDPYHPGWHEKDILIDLSHKTKGAPQKVAEYLYPLGGRFVLIISAPENTFVFHDPCGLRMVHYTRNDSFVYLASQPNIFRYAFSIEPGENFKTYYNSDYVKTRKEHYLPSGCTLFENIYHLVPNHYLSFSDYKQIRYFPGSNKQAGSLDSVVSEAGDILQKIMNAASSRFDVAFALTSGWDSRLLLAASQKVAGEFYFYTFKRRGLTEQSPDLKIPGKILRYAGYKHHIIDVNKKMEVSFEQLYKNHTSIDHMNDWGYYIHGALKEYPFRKVTIQGACDIYKCKYYPSGHHNKLNAADQILDLKTAGLERGWKELPFLYRQFDSWFLQANEICKSTGFDILDLMHWEMYDGSWLPQGQIENDLVMEIFTPLNNRKLIDIMLSVSPGYRSAPERTLLKSLIKYLWPELLKYAVNPAVSFKEQLSRYIKHCTYYSNKYLLSNNELN